MMTWCSFSHLGGVKPVWYILNCSARVLSTLHKKIGLEIFDNHLRDLKLFEKIFFGPIKNYKSVSKYVVLELIPLRW